MHRSGLTLLLLPLSLLVLAPGCVETEDFAYCPIDPCIHQQCSEDPGNPEGTTITYSCAVQHPQCPDQRCLRLEGSSPFCTKVCDPNVPDDCPADSTCQEYLGPGVDREAVFYCVPNELPPDEDRGVQVCNSLENPS